KISDREAQQKRLLSSRKTGTTTKSASPTKGKAQGPKPNGPKVLSSEYVIDSDSDSEDQALSVKTKPAPSVNGTRPASTGPVSAAKNGVAAAPKPKTVKPKQPAKPVQKPTPSKRRREEEDDDSSSSGTPLSKRLKQKPAKPKAT